MKKLTLLLLSLGLLQTCATLAAAQTPGVGPGTTVDAWGVTAVQSTGPQTIQTPSSVPAPLAALPDTNKGMAALQRANAANRYLFILFHNAPDEHTDAMWNVIQSAMAKSGRRAESIAINILDPNEKPVVDYFNVSRAPMPLALSIAPNGAVMGGFPTTFTEAQILQSFGTPAMENAMKALQAQKLVLLCIHNQATQSNEAAMVGVNEVKTDPQLGPITETVFLDPANPAEGRFLSQLQIDPKVTVAQTVFMVPPGSVAGKFMGGTTKTMLLSKLQTACGPGGVCGPDCGPNCKVFQTAASSQPQPDKKGIFAKIKSAFGN